MKVIGLTGGSGSGKTTAAGFIREMGIKVVDADSIARDITVKGSPAIGRLVDAFGSGILLPDGNLDRKSMADRIFSDPKSRAILESIVTEGVIEKIKSVIEDERSAGTPVLVIDAPTLFETGSDALCDKVWLVTASEAVRLKRLSKRDGISEKSLKARINGQLSEEEKASRSNVVIENDGTAEELKEKVRKVVRSEIAGL